MNLKFLRKLPTPIELKQIYPISDKIIELKKNRDNIIREIISGKSDKLILIVGPCSAHDEMAVLDYTKRLSKLQIKYEEKILIIPRIYTIKPRTDGSGYKGLLHQPNHRQNPDILKGIEAMRCLHINVAKESGLTAADEILYPEIFRYINDVVSYVSVGARSVENQFHRLVASGLDCACGMKNPTFGDFNVLINSIKAAQSSHSFMYRGWEVESFGNDLTHAILRGYTDINGFMHSNYDIKSIEKLLSMYHNLKNPSVIIDVSHANSNKNYKKQHEIALQVMKMRSENSKLKSFIKGIMIESFIEEGKQTYSENIYGKSITDACIGWIQTEELISEIAEYEKK